MRLVILFVATLQLACAIAQAQMGEPGTALAGAPRPETQLQFCRIIETADAAYEPQNAAWYAETNAIAQSRLTPKLAAMRDERDMAILNLVGPKRPAFQGWILRVSDIGGGISDAKAVKLQMSPRCTNYVSMIADFVPTPQLADKLAPLPPGAYVRVTGAFVSHDADRNSAARALDWDGFERTAMHEPSYRFTLVDLSME